MWTIPGRMQAIEMFGDKSLEGKVSFERHICAMKVQIYKQ